MAPPLVEMTSGGAWDPLRQPFVSPQPV